MKVRKAEAADAAADFVAAVSAAFGGVGETTVRVPLDADTAPGRSIIVAPGKQHSIELLTFTRCRKCAACRRARAALWSTRAIRETALAPRTWFGRLSYTPGVYHRRLVQARVRLDRQGIDFETLPEHDQFTELFREMSRDVTLYFKRLRKQSGVPLRYIVIAERGDQFGRAHFHTLIHEVDASRPLLYKHVSECWQPYGHERMRLVDPGRTERAARYVCKYIAKAMLTRVRASIGYGNPDEVGTALMQRGSIRPEGIAEFPNSLRETHDLSPAPPFVVLGGGAAKAVAPLAAPSRAQARAPREGDLSS